MRWWCAVFHHPFINKTLARRTIKVCTKEETRACLLTLTRIKELLVSSQARSILFTIHLHRMAFSTILNQQPSNTKVLFANIRLKSATANSTRTTLTIIMLASNQVWERKWDRNLRKELVEVDPRRRYQQRDLTTLWLWFNRDTSQTWTCTNLKDRTHSLPNRHSSSILYLRKELSVNHWTTANPQTLWEIIQLGLKAKLFLPMQAKHLELLRNKEVLEVQ